MDKSKTLEVLRGMKFMQRKEEAKRRATFEVAQRAELEQQFVHAGSGGDDSGGVGASTSGPRHVSGAARAIILYDDAFPMQGYGLSRRSFTDALDGSAGATALAPFGNGAIEQQVSLADVGTSPTSADITDAALDEAVATSEEEVEDLWGGDSGEDDTDGDAVDPTASPDARRRGGGWKGGDGRGSGSGARGDGRFVVASSVRAPKLPRRLQESVEEQERHRKRRRAEERSEMDT
ncbi:hypothetical protein NESM_000504900 [Novymonas esmeraldas]|uniref:Uncharacterized protein n=1 Tax=Novymonas esmeraldas TaxID=1808958 RepID=A0AAW0ENY3_9TRYP